MINIKKERENKAMKMTTIRELLTIAVRQALKKEILLKSEVEELINQLLDNSNLTVSPNYSIDLHQGNIFGIGTSNKDRELPIAQYILFTFTKSTNIDIVAPSEWSRSWSLKSFHSFQQLESFITCNYDNNIYMAVLVNGEPFNFEILEYKEKNKDINAREPVYQEVLWESQIYKLSYKCDRKQFEELFNSKQTLENHLIDQVNKDADCIRVFNTLDNHHIGFRVVASIYSSGGKIELTER